MSAQSHVLTVTDANFAAEVEAKEGLTVVDFWATWCAPCRMIAPIVDALATDYEGKVRFAKLDTDANPHVAARYSVRSLPTLLIFRDGVRVDQIIGAVPRGRIEAKLQEHLATAAA